MNEQSNSLPLVHTEERMAGRTDHGYNLQKRAGRLATWLTAGAAALGSFAGRVMPSSAETKATEPGFYYTGGHRLELDPTNSTAVFDLNGNGNPTDDPSFNRYSLVQVPKTPTEKAGISTTYAGAFNAYDVRDFKTLEEFLRANLAHERGYPEVMKDLALAFKTASGDTTTVFLDSFYDPQNPLTGRGKLTDPTTYNRINSLVEEGRLVDILTADPASFGTANWDYVAGNHPNKAFHVLRYRVGPDGEKLPYHDGVGDAVYHLLVQPEARGDRPAHTIVLNPEHMRKVETVQADTVTVSDTLRVTQYIPLAGPEPQRYGAFAGIQTGLGEMPSLYSLGGRIRFGGRPDTTASDSLPASKKNDSPSRLYLDLRATGGRVTPQLSPQTQELVSSIPNPYQRQELTETPYNPQQTVSGLGVGGGIENVLWGLDLGGIVSGLWSRHQGELSPAIAHIDRNTGEVTYLDREATRAFDVSSLGGGIDLVVGYGLGPVQINGSLGYVLLPAIVVNPSDLNPGSQRQPYTIPKQAGPTAGLSLGVNF